MNILDKTITHFIQKPSKVEDNGSGLNANENEYTFRHDGNVISNSWHSNGIYSDFEGGFRFGTTTIKWKVEDNQGNDTEASVDVISDFGWLTESRVNTPVENAPTAYSSSLYNFFDLNPTTVKTFPNRSYGQGSSDSSSPMYPHSSGPLSYVKQGAWTGTLTLKGEWIQFNKFHNNTWWNSDSGSRTNYGRSIRLWSDNRVSETASQFPHTVAVIGSNSNNYGSGTTDTVLLTRISGMVWNDHGSDNSFYGRYYSPSINLGSSREYDYYRIVFEKIHGGSSQASVRNVRLSYIQYVSDNDSDYLTVSGIESDSTRPENIVSNNSQIWATKAYNGESFPQDCPYNSSGSINSTQNGAAAPEYSFISYIGTTSYKGHWLQINTSSNRKSLQNGSIEDTNWKSFGFKCQNGFRFRKIVIIGSNTNNIGKKSNNLTEANNLVYETPSGVNEDSDNFDSIDVQLGNNPHLRVGIDNTGYTFYRVVFLQLYQTSQIKIRYLRLIPNNTPTMTFRY